MLVVIPYFDGDEALAKSMLEWCIALDGSTPNHTCLLVTCSSHPSEVGTLANRYFKSVSLLHYEEGRWKGWPLGPNRAFRSAALHVQSKHQGPWMWLEPDCVPLRTNWLDAIETVHQSGGKPFSGYVVDAETSPARMTYMAGCGVYPHNLHRYSVNPFLVEKIPFDVSMSPHVRHLVHRMNGLIQHEATDKPAPFMSDDEVDARIPMRAALFHKCKDNSLISLLRHQLDTKVRRFAWKKKPRIRREKAING